MTLYSSLRQAATLRLGRNLLLVCLASLLTACGSYSLKESERADSRLRNTPAYQPVNAYREDVLPLGIHRVVMLPLVLPRSVETRRQDITESFRREITRTNAFEVVIADERTLYQLFNEAHFSSTDLLPANFLTALHEYYDADGLLFTDITQFDAYQPLQLGVRTSLVSLYDAHTIWAFDDLFAAGDPRVASGALAYQDNSAQKTFPYRQSRTVLSSPYQFSQYVAHEIYGTLPRRSQRLPDVPVVTAPRPDRRRTEAPAPATAAAAPVVAKQMPASTPEPKPETTQTERSKRAKLQDLVRPASRPTPLSRHSARADG